MKVGNTLKETILLNYDQEELFSKYMGIAVSEISSCVLDRAYKVNNPLRIDKQPSLGFYYDRNGKLKCWDYAVPLYRFDIFDLVGYIIRKDVNNASGFISVCRTILKGSTFNISKKEILKSSANNVYKVILPMYRDWYKSDVKYWKEHGVNIKHAINRYTSPITHAYINSKAVYLNDSISKYCYFLGMHNGVALYKLYGVGEDIRFITNNKFKIEAPHELYKANTLIITKARKDKLAIESNIADGYIVKYVDKGKNLYDSEYCITNLSGESIRLSSSFVNTLRKNYKKIVLNLDFDLTGIITGMYHKLKFDLDTVYLGNDTDILIDLSDSDIHIAIKQLEKGTDKTVSVDSIDNYIALHPGNYSSKDVSAYIKANGKEKGKQLIERLF